MNEGLEAFSRWLETEKASSCLDGYGDFPIQSFADITDKSMQIIADKNFKWDAKVPEKLCSDVVFINCVFDGSCFASGVHAAIFINCTFVREVRFEEGLQMAALFGCTFREAIMAQVPNLNSVWIIQSELYGLTPPTGRAQAGLFEYIDCTFAMESSVNGPSPYRFIPATRAGDYGYYILQTNRGFVMKDCLGWFFVNDPSRIYVEPYRIATDRVAVSPPDTAACEALFSIGMGAGISRLEEHLN